MAKSRFLSGFETQTVHANGIVINVATAGSGPAVLLLHGHPQTHVVLRHVAPRLKRFRLLGMIAAGAWRIDCLWIIRAA
jgi:haloacetate dehalogenase